MIACWGVDGSRWPGGRNVEVAVARQTSRTNRAFEPLGPPVVIGVSPASGVTGTRLLISGDNFGDFSDDILAVRIGEHACVDVTHRSRSAVECVVPEIDVETLQGNSGLTITVLSRAGLTSELAADTPVF